MPVEYKVFNVGEGRSFLHHARNGTTLRADSYDLSGRVVVTRPVEITDAQFAADLLQIGGYHGALIHPELSSFGGYDTVLVEVVNE